MTAISPPSQTMGPSLITYLLRRFAETIGDCPIEIVFPNGRTEILGRSGAPSARAVLRSWRAIARIAVAWDVGLAESYMAGEWTTPDLAALLGVLCKNEPPAQQTPLAALFAPLARLRHRLNENTHTGSRRNIAAHYDLGNDFYRRWLDADMNYSSAIYSAPGQSLEDAQSEKLRRIAELLNPLPGHDVLEIGCGWGSLARHLARTSGCRVTALTLSCAQLDFARAFQSDPGCEFLLRDYRDATGAFDRIVSVEMIEAVGERYWPRYFATLRDRLKPDGTAVVQAITIAEDRFEAYRRRPDFIQRYIFPGGMLLTKSAIVRQAREAGLTLTHSEHFGSSYARTLASWAERFQRAWSTIEGLGFDVRFKRMWEFYLAYCQAGFETGAIDVGLYKFVRAQ